MIISIIDNFFPLEYGNIKNASDNAKPKWIALAGKPLNIPILNQKGKGEAYQSWNKDQIIAIAATIFKCKPLKFFVGDKSSWILCPFKTNPLVVKSPSLKSSG